MAKQTDKKPAPAVNKNLTEPPREHPVGCENPDARVKVRAIRMGYYDVTRRRVGDVFTIRARARDFSATWMERVAATTPEAVTTGQQELRRQHDEILQSRMPASGTPLVDDELPTGAQNPLDV